MRSLSSIAAEVAALTGKEVKVIHGKNFCVGLTKDNVLTMMVPPDTEVVSDIMRAGIFHECMHVNYTDFGAKESELEKICSSHGLKNKNLVDDFLQITEDIRIERKGCRRFPGAHSVMSEAHDINMTNSTLHKDVHPGKRFLFLNYGFIGDYIMYPDARGKRFIFDYRDDLLKDFTINEQADWWKKKLVTLITNKQTAKVWEGLDKLGELFENSKTTLEAIEIGMKYLFPRYLEFFTEEERKQMQDSMQEILIGIKAGTLPQKTLEDGLKEIKGGGNEEDEMGGWLPSFGNWYGERNSQIAQDIVECSEKLERQLYPLVQEIRSWQDHGGYEHGQRRGILDTRSLAKTAFDDDHVFKQRDRQDFNDDIAYSLLMDISGSMTDTGQGKTIPLVVAGAATIGIARVIEAIGKPASVTLFDNDSHTIQTMGKSRRTLDLAQNIAEKYGGGTSLLEGYTGAIDQMKRACENTKVMFIITDGGVDRSDLEAIAADKTDVFYYFFLIGSNRGTEELVWDYLKDKHFATTRVPVNEPEIITKNIIEFTEKLIRNK